MRQRVTSRLAARTSCRLLALFAACVAGMGFAQSYPSRAIRLVSPYPPGGPNDIVARLVAQRMSLAFRQQWIVDNRPGRGGNIGTDLVAKSAPDGYTLVHGGMGSLTLGPFLTKLPYDALRDFAPVTLTARVPNAIAVHPSLPARSVKELIALARARPGELNFGSPSPGSPNRLAMELFMIMAKVKMTNIPYKGGSGQMVTDLVAGQVQLASMGLPPSIAYIKAGRLRALAVTSEKRAALLPDLPTVSEAGLPGFNVTSWFGVFAPAALPRNIVTKVNGDVTALLGLPDVKERLERLGAEPEPQSPDDFARFVRAEIARWGKVVKASGATVD